MRVYEHARADHNGSMTARSLDRTIELGLREGRLHDILIDRAEIDD